MIEVLKYTCIGVGIGLGISFFWLLDSASKQDLEFKKACIAAQGTYNNGSCLMMNIKITLPEVSVE